jgi:YggT family protein
MHLIAYLLSLAVDIYIFIIILQVIISWLVIFGVINLNHPQAKNLTALIKKLTDPVYKPVQKYIPPIGGIDLTPLIVIMGLSILRSLVVGALYAI